nr:uncharacterized protein LOC111415197 [Onthophagus taurus]XP_022902521.1 uncharacterized protein LOC111415197 [Onthophagus taurus]
MPRFEKWIEVCGNDKLYTIYPKRIYDNYRVCHLYFTKADILSSNLLLKTAIPNRFLPNVQATNNTTLLNTVEQSSTTDASASSISQNEILMEAESSSLEEPGTSKNAGPSTMPDEEMLSFSSEKEDKGSLLQEVEVRREKDLSPKARTLYKRATHYKRLLLKQKQRNVVIRNRLAHLENMNSNELLKVLKFPIKLNGAGLTFLPLCCLICPKKFSIGFGIYHIFLADI